MSGSPVARIHSDLTLGGAGVTRIQNATVNGLTVTGEAEVEGTTANIASGRLYVNEDLTVDGTLALRVRSSGRLPHISQW